MVNDETCNESALCQYSSIVLTFTPPARRLLLPKPIFGHDGSVVDLSVDEIRYYCEESPFLVQPDLLVESASRRAIGLVFEIPAPDWMVPRCHEMLRGLDATAIRICGLDSDSNANAGGYIGLEILWGKTKTYERAFAQLDFGLWAFLYSSPTPNLFHSGTKWSTPAGLVIGDLTQLAVPVLVENSQSGEKVVEKAIAQ